MERNEINRNKVRMRMKVSRKEELKRWNKDKR